MGWFSPSTHRSHSRPGSVYSSYSRGPSSSYYKRRPRDNYIQMLYRKFKHLLRELYNYARRHPVKIFFLVIMPLISGGVLHQVARQFGITLPAALRGSGGGARGFGGSGGGYGTGAYDSGYYGSQGYESEGLGGMANLGNVMKVAKMFI